MILFHCDMCGERIDSVVYELVSKGVDATNLTWTHHFHWHCVREWVEKHIPRRDEPFMKKG